MTRTQAKNYVSKEMFEFREKLTDNNISLVAGVLELMERARTQVALQLLANNHAKIAEVDKAMAKFTKSQVWNILAGRERGLQQ